MSAIQIDLALLQSRPLRTFSDDSSKADYGKLLIVAGSARLAGAAILCARAALRTGCGTVRVAAPKSVATPIGIAVPELMVIPLPETSSGTIAQDAMPILEQQFQPCDAAIIGPGLDADDETDQLCRDFVAACPLPLVVDASALLACAQSTLTPQFEQVWTPHDGEMKALIDGEVKEDERETIARDWARSHQSTLALKGRATLIANPSGEVFRNTAGTRGMGTAGSGDVLSGVIGALLAQKHDATTAAMYGVHLHALAGEDAAKHWGDDGMMASDFESRIPFVLRELRKQLRR